MIILLFSYTHPLIEKLHVKRTLTKESSCQIENVCVKDLRLNKIIKVDLPCIFYFDDFRNVCYRGHVYTALVTCSLYELKSFEIYRYVESPS